MNDKLFKITNEEYLEKDSKEVIDGKLDKSHKFILNAFFSKHIRPTKKYLMLKDVFRMARQEYNQTSYHRQVYDHMRDFRILVPNNYPNKTIRCTFSSPYNNLEELKKNLEEPWILDGYKIYLVNPLLYKYQQGTLTLALIDDLDKKSGEGETDYWVKAINEGMIEETGEPLFYLI